MTFSHSFHATLPESQALTDEVVAQLRKVASDQVVVNIVLAIGCYMSIARLIAVTGIGHDAEPLKHFPSSLD